MGIYLGQLPPAEIARLKAELAETLIANFCYPRFFDHRTETLRTRPVDRTKRQEVWLYLSSFDFTAWNRVDLMSPDLQHHIERLFIQFMQRNRSFFGTQGRKRMSDIRLLIGATASSVVQGLRGHLSGQRQQKGPSFGSPRPVVSWSALAVSGRPEPTWEQIQAATTLLQQQLQEARGEIRPASPLADGWASNGVAAPAASASRTIQAQDRSSNGLRYNDIPQAPTIATPLPPASPSPASPLPTGGARRASAHYPAASATPTPSAVRERRVGAAVPSVDLSEQPTRESRPLVPPREPATSSSRPSGPLNQPLDSPVLARKSGQLANPGIPGSPNTPKELPEVAVPTFTKPASVRTASSTLPVTPPTAPPGRSLTQSAALPAVSVGAGQREMMNIGEDDVAIFEQLRHQLLVWLRVEVVRAGLVVSPEHGPAQLLDLLRQHARQDETRLQVVSTLLNLSNQVIKTGLISILDYKQALMFHLMHTRR